MSNTADILFVLLRTALSGNCERIPADADWQEVLSLASKQGVAAVAFEAIDHLPATQRPDMSVLMEWLGRTGIAENSYASQWTAAQSFGKFCHNNGARCFVLKGFSVSRLYPTPSHRFSCDMDAYCIGADGLCCGPLIDNLLEQKSICVDRSYYKNSKFCIKGLTVENHRHLLPVKGSHRAKCFERILLKRLLPEAPIYIADSRLESPSPLFMALHVLAHAQEHFFEEAILLRHICDWAVILKSERANSSLWNEWQTICAEFGLLEFGYAMSCLAHKICGVEIPFSCPENNKADELLLNDILSAQHSSAGSDTSRRIDLIANIFRNRWKYRYFSNTTALAFAFRRVWGFLFEKE